MFRIVLVRYYLIVLCDLHCIIEELSTQWRKLTLFESKENRVALRFDTKKREFVLAGKFFTRRSLNVGAATKTFGPLWWTKGGFNVTYGGENIPLFAFELEVDAEQVIQGKPWAFDRHLVVFERFDGYTSIHALGFKTIAFWVQIHNLPFPLQTIETAFSIGETIGSVINPKDLGEMLGANFIRVRVIVDVSKPLCRGRKISCDAENEGWAAFIYEQLPNICYWCGSVSHDDKDCSLWLRIKGTLKSNEQQFGPWIRAPLFNSAKKSFVKVKGYDSMYSGVAGSMTLHGTHIDHDTTEPQFRLNNITIPSTSQVNIDNDLLISLVRGNMEAAKHVSSLERISTMLLEDGQNATEENPSFEEQLHALDKEINCSLGFPKLNPEFSGLPSITDPLFSHATSSANVSKAYPDFIGNKIGREVDSLETIWADEFKVGWTSINKEKKGSCGRPKKSTQEESFNVDERII